MVSNLDNIITGTETKNLERIKSHKEMNIISDSSQKFQTVGELCLRSRPKTKNIMILILWLFSGMILCNKGFDDYHVTPTDIPTFRAERSNKTTRNINVLGSNPDLLEKTVQSTKKSSIPNSNTASQMYQSPLSGFHPALSVHNYHNINNKNNLPKDCLRIVIPVARKQLWQLSDLFSFWENENAKPCDSTRLDCCIHVHVMLDNHSKKSNYDDVLVLMKSVFDETVNHHPCVGQYTFSIFEGGDASSFISSYLAWKHLIYETHALGYVRMALMETTSYPLKPNWMNEMYSNSFDGSFIVKGSVFHDGPVHSFDRGHINSNCLWNIGDFKIINQTVEALDATLITQNTAGYNVMIYQLFLHTFSNYLESSGKNQKKWEFVNNFVTDESLRAKWIEGYVDIPYIVSAQHNLRPNCSVLQTSPNALEGILEQFPNYLFVHCKFHNIIEETAAATDDTDENQNRESRKQQILRQELDKLPAMRCSKDKSSAVHCHKIEDQKSKQEQQLQYQERQRRKRIRRGKN